MASIRSRNGKWQARITRKDEQPIAKSFQSKQDAERWASRGRAPSEYVQLDLIDPEQLAIVILKTLSKQ